MTRWRLGEAEIEALLAAGELQPLVGDAAQGEPWLTKATRTLQTAASVRSTDPSSAYVLAMTRRAMPVSVCSPNKDYGPQPKAATTQSSGQ